MCSIYGCLGEKFKSVETFCSKELSHRGPDDNGAFYDESISLMLGHTRLSIIDLSSQSNQPMLDPNTGNVIVFNGEVYNYLELKKLLEKEGVLFQTNSDTEVVLKSYAYWGADCLNNFRGMFAFCIYEKRNKNLFLARDRFGIKPLIYSFQGNNFIFSSELKPLLTTNLIAKKFSMEAVYDFFKYGSVKQPLTILSDVYQLMPGHFMKVKKDRSFEVEKYYDYVSAAAKIPMIASYDEALERIRNELETATRYHMVADVEVGAFLSGGIDSTAVVAMMKHYCDKKINTFSVGFKDDKEVEDETDVASRTAHRLGCEHHNILIDDNYVLDIFDDFIASIDQPSIDGINTYIVSKETSKDLKVALSGLGGDEIFAGYPHFKKIVELARQKSGPLSLLIRALNRMRPNRFTEKVAMIGLEEESIIDYQRNVFRNLQPLLKSNLVRNEKLTFHNDLSELQRISKFEIDNYMLNTLLRDNDVLSMAHSLEVRPVLLDHKLVELAFSLKDEFKIRNGRLKSIFIDSVKDLIPEEVWNRKKSGFEMPFSRWLNKTFYKKFYSFIDSSFARELFNKKCMKKVKKRTEHKSLGVQEWGMFIFLAWANRYDVDF